MLLHSSATTVQRPSHVVFRFQGSTEYKAKLCQAEQFSLAINTASELCACKEEAILISKEAHLSCALKEETIFISNVIHQSFVKETLEFYCMCRTVLGKEEDTEFYAALSSNIQTVQHLLIKIKEKNLETRRLEKMAPFLHHHHHRYCQWLFQPKLALRFLMKSFLRPNGLWRLPCLLLWLVLLTFLATPCELRITLDVFFPLPLVISSLRWGVIAGRKTMAATAMLLLVLSGPLKAATYLLMHGFLGLTMGSLWRSKMSWGASVLICTLVRSLGAMGFVFLSSWLIRDNILALITINAHASISFMLAAMGINFVPSMGSIYFIFGMLVLLNCGTFVFILHVLYAIFLKRLGLNSPLIFPAWLKAL